MHPDIIQAVDQVRFPEGAKVICETRYVDGKPTLHFIVWGLSTEKQASDLGHLLHNALDQIVDRFVGFEAKLDKPPTQEAA